MSLRPLDAEDQRLLATALGDEPMHVLPVHLLRRGAAEAYAEGSPTTTGAALLRWKVWPDEVMAHGRDPDTIWRLLRQVTGWRVVTVAGDHARLLAELIEGAWRGQVRHSTEVYHILSGSPPEYTHPLVRRLTLDDLGLFAVAPSFLQQGRAFCGAEGLLREGVIAGAIDDGRLVATAHTSAITARYADVAVATLEPYRRQGIAAAGAALVCKAVTATGRTPVWSCAEDNHASLRLAGKLGFTPVGRRVSLHRPPDHE